MTNYIDFIDEQIDVHKKHVTFSSLSQDLKVSSETSKQMLYDYSVQRSSVVSILYIISGIQKDSNQHVVKLISKTELEETLKGFSKIFSQQVYSVTPNPPKVLNEIWNTNFDKEFNNSSFERIEQKVGKMKEKKSPVQKKETKATPVQTKKETVSSIQPKKESPVQTKKESPAQKKESPAVQKKGIMESFTKNTKETKEEVKPEKQTKKENVTAIKTKKESPLMMMKAVKETSSKLVIKTSPVLKKEVKEEEEEEETEKPKKLKRKIEAVNSSSPSKEESNKKKRKRAVLSDEEESEKEEAPKPKKTRQVKKTVKVTENGYKVTKEIMVDEEIGSGEEEEVAPAPAVFAKKASPKKTEKKSSPKKEPAAKSKMKSTSITSFFKKK